MLSRAQKEAQVAELREKFVRATSVIVADYRGIDVQAANRLRRTFKQEGAEEFEYRVTKNTLLRRAVATTELAALDQSFQGPTAIAFAYGDPVKLAKILVDYAREHEAFELRAGWLEGRAIDGGEIATLATLPSLDELRGQLAGLLQAPATKLVRLLLAPGEQLARLVEARREKIEESG